MEEQLVTEQLPLKDRLKSTSGRKRKTFDCPLIGEVTVRNLTAREQIELDIPKAISNLEAVSYYIAACLEDEDQNLIYARPDAETGKLSISEEGRAEILALDPRVLAAISREIRDFLGLDIGVKTEAKNS